MYKNSKNTLAVIPGNKILNISELMYLKLLSISCILDFLLYQQNQAPWLIDLGNPFGYLKKTKTNEQPVKRKNVKWKLVYSCREPIKPGPQEQTLVLSEYHILFPWCHITFRSPDLYAYFVKVAVCLHSGQCFCVCVTSLMVACSSSSLSEALSWASLLFSMSYCRWVVCSWTDTIIATFASPVISFMAKSPKHVEPSKKTGIGFHFV